MSIKCGLQVKVNLKDSFTGAGYFVYVVLYDKERLKVEDIQWSDAFTTKFLEVQNAYAKADKGDYVLLVGAYLHPQESENTEDVTDKTLATITFSYQKEKRMQGQLT